MQGNIIITGANRGLGLALVHKICLSKDCNFIVNITVRDL